MTSWAQTYPRDVTAHGLLAGFSSQGSGKFELSIDEAQKAIELDPDFMPAHASLVFSYVYLDRQADADHAFQRASGQQAGRH